MVELNSKMPFLDYDIVLSDCERKSVHVNIKEKSLLVLNTDKFAGGQKIFLSFSCNPVLKDDMDKNASLLLESIPIKISYKFYGYPHSILVNTGIPDTVLSTKTIKENDILYEKIIALDHRKVFPGVQNYYYCQLLFDNNQRGLKVFYSSNDRRIRILFDGLNRDFKCMSKSVIEPSARDIDVIRVILFRAGRLNLESPTLSFNNE